MTDDGWELTTDPTVERLVHRLDFGEKLRADLPALVEFSVRRIVPSLNDVVAGNRFNQRSQRHSQKSRLLSVTLAG